MAHDQIALYGGGRSGGGKQGARLVFLDEDCSVPYMIPWEIIELAEKLSDYFKEHNIKEWKLGDVQNRTE